MQNAKKKNNLYPYFLNFSFNIFALILLYIGTKSYLKSLKGCKGEEFSCISIRIQWIYDDIHFCLLSAFYYFCFLFLIQLKLCSFYQLLLFFFIIILLIIKDHGDSFLNHGIMNFISLSVFLIVGEIIILTLILVINLIKKKKYNLLFSLLIGIIIIFAVFYIKNKDKYYCKNWDKGINNTYINGNESEHQCSIKIPKKRCLIEILSPILDFSKILNIKCEKRKEEEKYLLKEKSNLKNSYKINKIGFPITIGDVEEIKGKPALYSFSLYKYVLNNLIDLENKNITNNLTLSKKYPEIILDYTSDPYGQIIINVNYDEKLSLKRKQLEKNKSSNNIIFIFLDNLSRVHFYRQYKRTVQFLKKFFDYKGFSINNGQKFHGFEFMKYHKFEGATLHNAIPMFCGVPFNRNSKMISIVKELKKLGYITCNVQDICHKELMGIGKMKSYSYIEFDHEYAAPNCDPNIYKYGFGFLFGENQIIRKCSYGKEMFEYSLDYAQKFWKSYNYNKRFLRIVNTYAHEYSGENSKYADNALFNFLNDLFNTNQLENTNVFITGDHGFALMGIYKFLYSTDWEIEQHLPIFILLVPDQKNVSYHEQYSNILKNQYTLITSFDIYYTIRDIIYGSKYKEPPLNGNKNDGESVFKFINSNKRKCNKYKGIRKCQCIIKKKN